MEAHNLTVVNETTTDLKFKFKNLEMNTRYTVFLQTASPYTQSEVKLSMQIINCSQIS